MGTDTGYRPVISHRGRSVLVRGVRRARDVALVTAAVLAVAGVAAVVVIYW